MPNCTQCTIAFHIDDTDRQFYQKLDLPNPKMCPPCRMQRRIMFRNFENLYHRKCDLTGKQIISMYDKDFPGPVFEMHEWWGDKWNALDYGFEPDWNHSIFDQLKRLHTQVPRMSIMNQQCENTDYCNLSFQGKDCYLVFGNVQNENCCYGHIVWQSKSCFDCLYVYRSELCYQCVDCVECYDLAFSQGCENCSSSRFLVNCQGVRNCFGCVGLKNKEYHIFNEPHTKEEYEAKMAQFNSGNVQVIEMAKKRVKELIGQETVKHFHGFNCENVTGDYLYNCKNTFDSYDAKNCEDIRYCATVESFIDCHDCNYCPAKTELTYNCVAVFGYKLLSCHNCTDNANLSYCDNCYGWKDGCGCVGLKNKQYCIFNKQYSKTDYEALLPKVIAHMKSTGEWGQFFPANFSPFAYNETMACEYFPLTQEQVKAKEWRWKEEDAQKKYKGPPVTIPDDIKDVPNDFTKQILTCETSGKLYKVIPQELAFYRQQNLPIPRRAPDQRHKDRMALRNPRNLWDRTCSKCKKIIRTTYAPERPERVYCEKCYLAGVY
jgi:hypothetical protein